MYVNAFGIAIAVLSLSALSASAQSQVGDPAPAFSARDISGRTISLSDYRGKIVVLESYIAAGCPFCEMHYKNGAMQGLQAELTAKGVIWLLVDFDAPSLQTPATARQEWIDRKIGATDWIMDYTGSQIGKPFGLTSAPEAAVIDKAGNLVYRGAFDNANVLLSRTPQFIATLHLPPGLSLQTLLAVRDQAITSYDSRQATNYVRDSVNALLLGDRATVEETRPYGCQLQFNSKIFASNQFQSATASQSTFAQRSARDPRKSTYVPKIGHRAPNFTIADISGKTINLSNFRGKTVVLESYYNGCPFCDHHYATGAMQAVQKEAAAGGAVWLVIDPSDSPARAQSLWSSQALAITDWIQDANHDVARAYGFKTAPEAAIIDKNGNLAYQGAFDDLAQSHADAWSALEVDPRTARNFVHEALQSLAGGDPVQVPITKPYGCALIYPGMPDAQLFAPPSVTGR